MTPVVPDTASTSSTGSAGSLAAEGARSSRPWPGSPGAARLAPSSARVISLTKRIRPPRSKRAWLARRARSVLDDDALNGTAPDHADLAPAGVPDPTDRHRLRQRPAGAALDVDIDVAVGAA